MKIKKTELDVDFIGGQTSLTVEEEKALSLYFRERKLSSKPTLKIKRKSASSKREKALV